MTVIVLIHHHIHARECPWGGGCSAVLKASSWQAFELADLDVSQVAVSSIS